MRKGRKCLAVIMAIWVPVASPAGDILRGGGTAGPARQATATGGNAGTSAAANAARQQASDALARTTKAVQAVQQLQLQARAQTSGHNNLNPNNPSQQLPAVADGLRPGGLQIIGAPVGADAPSEAVAGGHTTVTVKQQLQQAFLEWQSFNVGRNTTVHFDQTAGGKNAGQWIAFNHVKDPTGVPSQILGQIKAEGQVYILNQNGIIFGGESQVNVHALVASALPINTNLVSRGLLNNPDVQHLFSALPSAAGSKGTPAFTPELNADKKIGDVTVQSGARITAPTSADKVGGRITLVGANVTNEGTIYTPDGQTILAAGLQVGMVAHSSSDPSLRGLDVYVGAVSDSVVSAYTGSAGKVINTGHIDSPRGNITLTGKTIEQKGALTATTSVAFNGRIDLNASYGAISNSAYDPTNSAFGTPFLYSSTGNITLGQDSVTQITPELTSTDKVVGTKLALVSQVNMMGQNIHLENGAMVLAPNANVTLNAGVWDLVTAGGTTKSSFVLSSGQVFMDSGSSINVAGTTDVIAQMAENIITLQLRGSEFADFAYNRDGDLRGVDITLDIRRQGIFNGRAWVGTPLADASGFVGLIQRGVDQLTTAGGTVKINAGGSVVMQAGSSIDVSGGYINYQGGMVQTTRVAYGNQLIDIADATPDRVYDGLYTGTFTTTSAKWGVSKGYTSSLMLGKHYEEGYIYGAAGGTISITAPSMALDGQLLGNTINGTRQREVQAAPSTLSLTFQGQKLQSPLYPTYSPTPPTVTFEDGVQQPAANAFSVDANGHAAGLRTERVENVVLSTKLLSEGGFGNLIIDNKDGNVIVAAGQSLVAQPKGSITLHGSNVTVEGSLMTRGGTISLNAYNISPSVADELKQSASPVTPAPAVGRGLITLGADAVLDASGMLVDDRQGKPDTQSDTFVLGGGSVAINGYSANLSAGSLIDVSGGARIDWLGRTTYGNGGSIAIKTGQDRSLPWVLGGKLTLGSELRGMAGAGSRGGSLAVQASLIQIGGNTTNPDVLLLQPDFFNQGGFSSHALTGIGEETGPEQYAPGVVIAPGTVIDPVVQNYLYEPRGDGSGAMHQNILTLPESMRAPIALSFSALGATDDFSRLLKVRGDVVFGEGAVIRAGPQGSVDFKGDTVTILGSVFAPGGLIGIKGADKMPTLDPNPTQALTTVHIGANAHLSAAGAVVLTPDPFGRRTGYVLDGGTITVSGNILAEQGAVLDVSGASGDLDVLPASLALTTTGQYLDGLVRVPYSSGLTTPLSAIAPVRKTIDSNGGTIILKGSQELITQAKLLGEAGGQTATGGSLSVSSGRFYLPGVLARPDDLNLIVTQLSAPGAGNLGYFAVSDFLGGGFDNLQLGGNIRFDGAIDITARGALVVATGGVLTASNDVNLTASYVSLGTVFAPPVLPTQVQNPFIFEGQPYYFPPTFGTGKLTVKADLIDIGNLSLRNIGNASLTANNGDIRGNGTFNIAGDVTMRAAQVYPVTGSIFTIAAYDHGGIAGSVTFEKSGVKALPMSAGGTLNIYASNIVQNGTLRAPFGVINLGWDGTGTAPKDLITGTTLPLPVTRNITLGTGSVTSVSAIDPLTNKGVVLAYGTSPNGTSWIDPSGVDITSSGLPAKAINIAGANIDTHAGSSIDLRGGGDLFAYRFVSGTSGTKDILADSGLFAVIPGYSPFFAPFGAFNANSAATNLNGDKGYVNGTLHVGDQIYLGGGGGLTKGTYTLLPAHYALMPGAFLVTPQGGLPTGNLVQPDGANFVNGYRYNALNKARSQPILYSNFEIASASTLAKRAQYDVIFANEFLTKYATEHNQVAQRLPQDSGQLVLAATASMALNGSVLSRPTGTSGRGGLIDISSAIDIVIAYPGATVAPGKLVLDSTQLSNFGAGSLLIGGVRTTGATGTTINVKTDNVTVANVDPGTGSAAELTGSEIILVANKKLTIEAGSAVRQSGILSGNADTLLFGNASVAGSGDGTLLRVSSDANAQILRSGVSSTATTANMTIGAGANISGNSITLDSTYATTLNATALIDGKSVSLNSGQISLQLTSPGVLQSTRGLVLNGEALNALQTATSLSLLSYTSIDIYGTGTVGSALLQNLALHAGEIRGFNTGGGTATFQAQNILIDNKASSRALGPINGSLGGTLVLDAQTIRIGTNNSRVTQYANLSMNAAKGLFVEGTGSLTAAGAITVNTPFISAARSATQSITAGGALTINNSGSASTVAGGLGASLSLQGSSVNTAADIVLPSGLINITATTGSLTVSGKLDVSGTKQTLYDLTKYTNGGTIALTATNGNVLLSGNVDVGAHAGGGEAGALAVNAARGTFTLSGTLRGKGGASFALDISALANTAALNATLNDANFTNVRNFRIRTGDVIIGGTNNARAFTLSADAGKIDVTGTINASGVTGGTINLMAARGLTLKSGAMLNVSATKYNSAGKGGSVSLETQGGASGYVSIESGSTINLSVAATAQLGQFSGTLHLRAPQNATATDLSVRPINGTIIGASSITAEGFKVYDLTGNGQLNSTVQGDILANGTAFGANDTAITNALFTGANASLKSLFSLQVGAEIINRTGDLTLGTPNPGAGSAAWNLSSFRFGTKQAPGVLTLRAAGNLVFNEALSDGFASGSYNAIMLGNNAALSDNAESWSYRLVAGADLTAVDFHQVTNGTGSLLLGRNAGDANELSTNVGANARTALALAGFYQVIRTGSGSIDIATGRDVQLLNQFATIYTAGTQVSDPTLGSTFDTPILDYAGGTGNLGGVQQSTPYAVQYSLGGGNVTINAGNDIAHYTRNAADQLVADSERQLPMNWLYRRGYLDPAGGFGTARFGDTASTTWWVDFSNFFEGVGALGGGNVTMTAGRDIANVDAVVPTNARMPKNGQSASAMVELGGGDLIVRTGRNLDAGVYYVERGTGTINAGGSIITNGTRSPSLTNLADAAPNAKETWLPTTLFVGKSTFDVKARGDLLLGPVSNPFLLPGGYNNSFWYKTYFSTYSPDAGVEASSLSGDVTLRENTTLPTVGVGGSTSILLAWIQNELLFNAQNTNTAAYYHPWLRLNESKVDSFNTVAGIMPGTLKVTAFSGSINLVGNLTLSPSAKGTLDLLAAGAINALQINGQTTTVNGLATKTWASSRINVSDADPDSIPGVLSPYAYQTIGGLQVNSASASGDSFLAFIDPSLRESGSTIGTYGVLQTKQALHAQGILHADDDEPLRIYAGGGDISGLTVFSPKAARIVSSQDIRDIALYIQNTNSDDVSVVSSGRDMILYDANSVLRTSAGAIGNVLNFGETPLAGDIQISGPGTLEVLAGRNLDLGTGSNNSDGTGVGITSIGNGRNPSLPFDGAHIIAGAGIGASYDLTNSALNFDAFITKFIEGADGTRYLTDYAKSSGSPVDSLAKFNSLSEEEQRRVAMEIFFIVLRNSGRDHINEGGDYPAGFEAIATLFSGTTWKGDIKTQARDIRTKSGGNINIFAPGGGLQLATAVIGQPLAPPGIITEGGGSISIFADKNIDIGISRIFTLRGGDEIIWSSHGDIAAGSSSKTVQSAPPTRVVIDPQSGDVKTDLAGLATGGGIGVLATVAGVAPGSVDLIAPNGTIDAGDAGIRATGNLNIAALAVLNSNNISVGGTNAGAAAGGVSAPNIGGLTSSSNTAAAASNTGAPKPEDQAKQGATTAAGDIPSIMSVEVLGYGGGDGSDEDEELKKKRLKTTES